MLLTCADLAKNLVELEEGNVSSFERAAMRLHLSICERCRRYVEQIDQVRRALAGLREPRVEGDVGSVAQPRTPASSLETALAAFHEARDHTSDADDEDLP